MKPRSKNQFMTLTAFLTALAIVIPLVMPIKIVIPPASFTLASHVAIFLAMFISPIMTVIVVIGSAIGFGMSGLPFIITLRALSHLLFASIGALYLQKHPDTLDSQKKTWVFNFLLALIHAFGEVAVCILFYTTSAYPANAFYILFGLVGLGTIIHSMVDFVIAKFIYKALKKIR